MNWIVNFLLGLYRALYAPALMEAVALASAKYGDVATFKAALCAPGNQGGIIQSQTKIPGTLRGWAVALVMCTPGDDMYTFLSNLTGLMGVHVPSVDALIAHASKVATFPVGAEITPDAMAQSSPGAGTVGQSYPPPAANTDAPDALPVA
jgi:hypothetical protein